MLKEVKGFEGLYSASDDGRIWSHRQKKFMKPSTNNHGYKRVIFHKDKKEKTMFVHRVILQTFNPTLKEKVEVNHIDGNKANNCLSNLEWVTQSENTLKAIDMGLHLGYYPRPPEHLLKGMKNPMAKLTDTQVWLIRFLYSAGGVTYQNLADMFNISQAQIGRIIRRQNRQFY